MARDISELGADVIDDTVDPKKKKISSKKRNYIIGLSCLGVGLLAVSALYVLSAKVWFIDYQNIDYLTISYPVPESLAEGEKQTASIVRLDTSKKYPSNFRIPAKLKLNGKEIPITKIEDGAFRGADRLEFVTMTDNIVSIGKEAFAGCENLKDFRFSKNITTIGDDAFLNTKYFNSFEEDKIETFGSILLYVGNDYFESNTVLLEDEQDLATLPDEFKTSTYNIRYFSEFADKDITYFKNALFKNNDKLAYIQLPSFLTSLPIDIFSGCTNLKVVDFKNTTFNEISDNAFKGCSSLVDIEVSEHINSIGKYAFSGSAIDSAIALEDVSFIGEAAYSNCKNITSVVLPDGFTSIPNYLFSGCTNLTNFSFTNADLVTSIGVGAFQNTAITSFRFPKYCSAAADLVLAGNTSLERVEMWQNANDLVVEGSNIPGEGETVEDLNTFIGADGTTKYGDVLGMKRINGQAFAGCTNLDTLALYDDNGALIPSASATGEINFPVTLTNTSGSSIDSSGKENFVKTKTKAVNLDANLKQVSESCFDGVSTLTSVTFNRYPTLNAEGYDSSMKTIQKYAFRKTGITSIDIPNSVTAIYASAFNGCKNLVSVHLPENPAVESMSIENGLFNGCSSLTTINIPSNVTKISSNAFKGCSSLTEIVIPEGCLTLEYNSFVEMGVDGSKVTVRLPFTKQEVDDQLKADKTTKLFIDKDWCDDTVNVIYKEA